MTIPTIASIKLRRLVKRRRDSLAEAMARNGANNLRMFGSVANGTARPDSDFDFMVDLDNPPKGRLFARAGLNADFSRILGRPVDVILSSDRFARDKVKKVMAV